MSNSARGVIGGLIGFLLVLAVAFTGNWFATLIHR